MLLHPSPSLPDFCRCYCLRPGLLPSLCCRVMVAGAGPSARYAHTLALVANRFLVAVGGNDGKQTLADSWALDTSEKPYQWRKIPESGDDPPPRCGGRAGGWVGGKQELVSDP